MAAAMPRHRRLEVLESALGQLEGTAQTMLGEITWLQRELSAVNADAYIDEGALLIPHAVLRIVLHRDEDAEKKERATNDAAHRRGEIRFAIGKIQRGG